MLRKKNQEIAFFRTELNKLSNRFPERLTLLDRVLSVDELIETYMQSDIIFMPYNSEIYKNQTSNVLAESMVCGKVLIVPELTWMADIVSAYKNGIVYKDGSADNIAEQFEGAVKNFAQLSQNALGVCREFAGYNNSKKLVDSLFTQ